MQACFGPPVLSGSMNWLSSELKWMPKTCLSTFFFFLLGRSETDLFCYVPPPFWLWLAANPVALDLCIINQCFICGHRPNKSYALLSLNQLLAEGHVFFF